MSDLCIVFPTIKVGNQEVESKLFRELASYTGSLKTAQELWAISQVDEFREVLSGLEYDENGEPTFESFSKAINIKEYLDGDVSLKGLKRDAGAIDKNGKTIEYTEVSTPIDKAISFNKENPKHVATVNRAGKKYTIEVEKKSIQNSDKPQELIFNNSLHNKLLGILRRVGFDIRVNENSGYSGIFNPLDATTTANGLLSVIQIAKGKRGEQAFPEEFAHAMIAGLGTHLIVVRLMNTLDAPVIREVLGDQFDAYYDKYNGNINRLRKEAAGKLLKNHIIGEQIAPQQRSLISRLWNWIKEKLGLINESSITDAYNEANREAGELAQFIMSEDFADSFDKELVLSEQPLYDLEREATTMKQLNDNALALMSKRMKILSAKSKSGKYKKEDLEAIHKLQDAIDKKDYAQGCTIFLTESIGQIKGLYASLKRLRDSDTRGNTDLTKVRNTSYVLLQIKDFADAYPEIIYQMQALPEMIEEGEIDVSSQDAEEISKLATKALKIINNINVNYKKLRFETVYNFLSNYWSGDRKINEKDAITVTEVDENGNTVNKKVDTITLGMIMKMANKDINGIDRWVKALGDSSDPMLNLINKVVKTSHMKRDATLNKILIGVRAAHRKLVAAGYTSDFMLERDKNGKLTGRIISDIDFEKFNEERNAYIKSLKEKGYKKFVIKAKVEKWESQHMEPVKIKGSRTERSEMMPRKDLYRREVLSNLSTAQRDYYDSMIELKALLEDQIPQRYANLYRAVQINKDMTEIASNNAGNPKKAVQLMLERAKSKFIRVADNTEYGEEAVDEEKGTVLLDFSGNPIDKLPVYYTTPLENPEMLSTDFTSSIMAYAGMAVNYGEISKVIDALELTRDLIKARPVQQMSGDNKLTEYYKVVHKKFRKAYTKPGERTNIGDRIDDYYESVLYGKHKKDQGTIAGINTAETLDSIKNYSGVIGLGLNLFSAISNVTMGKMQIFIEAVGGEYFGLKNSIVGKKNYYKDLPAYLAELNSVQKKSKMALLIDKFDALEEFYSDLKNRGYYKGALSRIIGNSNVFFLNNMGEHYLHTRTMLAMLDAYKVKEGKVEKSLYDVMEVVEKDGEYSIEIRDGVTKLDGSAITEDDINKLKLKIGRVNQSLNGAFNDADKGAIHRGALGRMAMQFRQWMPAHYLRRFGGKYYDEILEQYREGYYVTLGKFFLETIKDLRRGKFQLIANLNKLEKYEQANLKRAFVEIGTFILLSLLVGAGGPGDEKDKKGTIDRLIAYSLKRMKLETGASIPFPISMDFLDNIWTILQSPAASIKSFNNLTDLIKVWNIFNEVESGRYKGWSEYEVDLVQAFPIYGQIRKVLDISSEDYMFSVLNKD